MAKYKVPAEKLTEAASHNDLDAACIVIQDYLGIDDGGVAAMYFSGENGDNWPSLSNADRIEELTEYVSLENIYKKHRS